MTDHTTSTEIVQTMTRKAFDPEIISVVVGPHPSDSRTIWVRIRDEINGIKYEFNVLAEHTIADIARFIHKAGEELGIEPNLDPSLQATLAGTTAEQKDESADTSNLVTGTVAEDAEGIDEEGNTVQIKKGDEALIDLNDGGNIVK